MTDIFLVTVKNPCYPRVVGTFTSTDDFRDKLHAALKTLLPLHGTLDLVKKTSLGDLDYTWVSRMSWNNGDVREDAIILQDFLDRGKFLKRSAG